MTNVTYVTEEELEVNAVEIHKNTISLVIIRLYAKDLNSLLPYIRINKVLEIRHKLAEDKYEIKKRLDVAIDRLLKRLFSKVTAKPTDLQSLIPDDEVDSNVPEDPNYWPEVPSEFSENRKYLWLWN